MKDDIVIVSATRTPVGAFNGALASLPAHELGKVAVAETLKRAGGGASSTVALATGQIARYGVPRAAVEVVATARAVEAGSVDGGERPAIGGLRIAGFFEQTSITYTIICSYGPNVRNYADTIHRYMVVASHCVQHAPPVGGYIGANVYQPDATALHANLIGTVVTNPSFTGGAACPSGALCRASDAALVRVAPGVATTIGAIARPDDILFAAALPKTRSGKIMRRLLRDIAAGRESAGDTSTLEDLAVLAKLREDDEA